MSKKYAVLIGCNYSGTVNSLNGCQNDVLLFKDILISKYGYLESNILLLIDKPGYTYPTKKNIIDQITRLVTDSIVNKSAEFIFYYSGHGSSVTDTSGDEPDRRDEVIIPLDYQTQGIISDDYIYDNFVTKIYKFTNLYMVFDSCNSASCTDLPLSYESNGNIILKTVLSRRKLPNQRVYSISGCYDNNFSYEYFDPELKIAVGALSYFIRSVLKSNNYNCNLEKFLIDLTSSFRKSRLNQKPVLSVGNSSDLKTILFINK